MLSRKQLRRKPSAASYELRIGSIWSLDRRSIKSTTTTHARRKRNKGEIFQTKNRHWHKIGLRRMPSIPLPGWGGIREHGSTCDPGTKILEAQSQWHKLECCVKTFLNTWLIPVDEWHCISRWLKLHFPLKLGRQGWNCYTLNHLRLRRGWWGVLSKRLGYLLLKRWWPLLKKETKRIKRKTISNRWRAFRPFVFNDIWTSGTSTLFGN